MHEAAVADAPLLKNGDDVDTTWKPEETQLVNLFLMPVEIVESEDKMKHVEKQHSYLLHFLLLTHIKQSEPHSKFYYHSPSWRIKVCKHRQQLSLNSVIFTNETSQTLSCVTKSI